MTQRVEIIRREGLAEGFLRLARYRLRLLLPGGARILDVQRECVEGLRAAAVLPYDPRSGRIVLVEQHRIGALESAGGGWLHEPPGGRIEEGQTPEATARREAMEEAGCRIDTLIPIGLCRTAPGFSDESVALFCGIADASCLPAEAGCREEGEWTRVVPWDLEAAARGLGRDPLTSATLMVTVQWLVLNRDRLAVRGGGAP